MMEDVLKACASYHPTSTSPASVKLSSQAVGLLSLLAISGSVALLALGRQKLWQYVFDSPANASPVFPSSEIGVVAATAPRKIAAQFLWAEAGALESRGENDGNQMPGCSKSTTVVGRRNRSTLKKVRFAPDVVEPAGDGQEYRRRMKEAHRKQRQSKIQKNFNQRISEMQEEANQRSSDARQSTEEGKAHQRSSLPPNRIVLYNGLIRQNRLQQALQWS